MTLSLGFIYLAARLARLWRKEGGFFLKIVGELSEANCPGSELSGYLLNVSESELGLPLGKKVAMIFH